MQQILLRLKLLIIVAAAILQTSMTYSFNINHVLYCDVTKKDGAADLIIAIGKTKLDGKRDLLLKDNFTDVCLNKNDDVYCEWGSANLLFIESEVKESQGEDKNCYFLTGRMNFENNKDIPVRCTLSCQTNKNIN